MASSRSSKYERIPGAFLSHKEDHDSSQYGASDKNGRTPKSRNGTSRQGIGPALHPESRNDNSSRPRTLSEADGHHASNSYQPSRQQSTWSQNSAYGGVYGDHHDDQANSTTGHQQSSYPLPGQQSRGGMNAVPHLPHTNIPKTRQSNPSLKSDDAAEEPKQEPEKKTSKRKKGAPTSKCATLKKTIHKQGDTEVVNGQLMWIDPNEPENRKRSKSSHHSFVARAHLSDSMQSRR